MIYLFHNVYIMIARYEQSHFLEAVVAILVHSMYILSLLHVSSFLLGTKGGWGEKWVQTVLMC